MSVIHIPVWLKHRHIFPDDIFELRQIFSETGNQRFGDISSQVLKEYYHRLPGSPFYKLIKILGFYGVQFTGKLAPYSIIQEPFPRLLNIPQQYWEEPCPTINSSLSSYIFSLGIYQLKQLHGVPWSSINHVIRFRGNIRHKKGISAKVASELFFASFTKAHESFFENNSQIDIYETIDNSAKKFSENKGDNTVLLQPVDILNLSERSGNCLCSVDIRTIGELIQKTEMELLKIRNLGRKSIREIKQRLSGLELHLAMNNDPSDIKIRPKNELKIDSKETCSKLTSLLSDVELSVRCRNFLALYGVNYVWELVRFKENELNNIPNLGRKTIDELKNIVEEKGFRFGLRFTSDQIDAIQKFPRDIPDFSGKWFVDIAQNPLFYDLSFLNESQKTVIHERVWKCGKKRTLEDIAQEMNLTRERIRQIESRGLIRIKQRFQKELREATNDIRQQVEALGRIANLEDLKFQINISEQEQTIMDSLLSLQDDQVYIDWKFRLISSKGNSWIISLCSAIKKRLKKNISQSPFFSLQEVASAAEEISSQYQIFQNSSCWNLVQRFIHEENITEVEGHLHFGNITKQDRIAVTFKELFPRGLEIYKQRELLLKEFVEFDHQTYRNINIRAIEGHLTTHSDILLWGRGFMIHKEHLSFDVDIVKQVAAWIRQQFEQGYFRFRIHLPFNQFQAQLQKNGIPNSYALYSVLKNIRDKRIGQKRYPTIVDLDAGIELKESVLEELEYYFLKSNSAVSHEILKKEFLSNRGWKGYHLDQNLNRSDLIYPWKGNSYIHQEYLKINESKLNELITTLCQKLHSVKGAISLKGAKSELGVLWEQVCPSATTRTMAKLIRSQEPEGLAIHHNFIYLNNTSSEFVSASTEIENFILESKSEVTLDAFRKGFCDQRGWTENQFCGALRKASLFKSGKVSYIHPSTIRWNEELALYVSQVLKGNLQEIISLGQPYMQIEEVIYKDVLPELPNGVYWSRALLRSVGKEMEEFIFFDDAYIEVNNDYNIEDLDDMIAFLLARHTRFGIDKKEKVEQMLWKEGILESDKSLSTKLFFEGSSITYLESSNEIKLSDIGKKKYASD